MVESDYLSFGVTVPRFEKCTRWNSIRSCLMVLSMFDVLRLEVDCSSHPPGHYRSRSGLRVGVHALFVHYNCTGSQKI